MLSEKKKFSEITNLLEELSKHEKGMLWALKSKTNEERRIIESVYFQNRFLKQFNYNESFMTFYNYFKIMFAPFYGILSPVIFIILPFIYLKFFNGINIEFSEYWRIFRTTLFGGGGSLPNTNEILRGLQTARTPQQVNQTLRNASMRSNGKSISKMFSSFLTVVFYIQNVMNAIDVSKRTHETINAIHEKLNSVSAFHELGYKLVDLTKEYLNRDAISRCLPQLSNPTFKSSPGVFTNKGLVLTTYLNVLSTDKIRQLLSSLPIKILTSNFKRNGIGYSISKGIELISRNDPDGILILLGDMPDINSSHLDLMIDEFINNFCQKIIRACSKNKTPGNPLIFPKSFFNILIKLSGDIGAKKILEDYNELIHFVELPNLVALTDLDTIEEFEIWKKNNPIS